MNAFAKCWALLTTGITVAVTSAVSLTRRGAAWVAESGRRLRGVGRQVPLQRLSRTVRTGLFGRRMDVSATVLLIAPTLALATNYWATGVGYPRIERWVQGTWFGTEPQLLVFVGAAALLALATLSAVLNSGLVPTTLLAMGPVFGIAFARYGLTLEYYGTVGIPNAVTIGIILAFSFGVPIACAGFAIGTVARRMLDTLRGQDRGTPAVDQA